MGDPITRTQLENANLDVEALGYFVNNGVNPGTYITRTGRVGKTLAKIEASATAGIAAIMDAGLAGTIGGALIFASGYATLALADAAAIATGTVAVLDKSFTLSEDTELSGVWTDGGGVITLGDHDLDMSAARITASPSATLFDISAGSGFVTLPEGCTASVYWFGATGLGTESDRDAVQAAITAVSSNDTGTVDFGAGKFLVTGGLTISGFTGSKCTLLGSSAWIHSPNNEAFLTISGSLNVDVKGLVFDGGTIGTTTAQRGIYVTGSGALDIDCDFTALEYGLYADTTATGLETGEYPIASKISGVFDACAAGLYFANGAEYWDVNDALVRDCTLFGLTSDAGNVHVHGGTFEGNDVGIVFDGSNSSNGDHGSIIGTAVNHNAKCGIWLKNLDYSMRVDANVWASIATDFGAGWQATSFGVLLENVTNVNLIGSVLANSKVNLATNGVTHSNWSGVTFISDSARTTNNILHHTALAPSDGNIEGPSTFSGTLVDGANNNDPQQIVAPSLLNSWVNFGSTFRNAGYWKDGEGTVHLCGIVKSGTVPSTILTLPAGFRPSATITLPTVSNALYGYAQVTTSGDVSAQAGDTSWFSLDGISFKAEA